MRVVPIPHELTRPFILKIHYAHRLPCIQYAFGLYLDKSETEHELVGIVTYGQPASSTIAKGIATEEYEHRVLELNRLCLLPKYNGKNYASMLVGRSLRMLPKDYYIVSYSDTKYGHVGYVYQATNWIYTGSTKPRRYRIGKNGGHSRHYVQDGEMVERSVKHRYVYMTGNKKKQIKLLKWQIQPYPKGDTHKYEVTEVANKLVTEYGQEYTLF